MPVENVFSPEATSISNANAKGTPKEEGYYEKKTKEERSRLEFLEAKAMIDKLDNPPPPPEPAKGPIDIHGSINMGDVDLQAQAKEAKEAAEAARIVSEARLEKSEEARRAAEAAKHKTEMEMVSSQFNQKLDVLAQAIAAGLKQKDFAAQYNDIMTQASHLGLTKPSENTGNGGDITGRLAIMKLEQEISREARESKRLERREDKQWELEKTKLEDERNARAMELQQKAKRDEMWQATPTMLGDAIGKAIMAGGKSAKTKATAPAKETSRENSLHVGFGESGETACPDCGGIIAIGETARMGVCAKCNLSVPIQRVQTEPDPGTDEE